MFRQNKYENIIPILILLCYVESLHRNSYIEFLRNSQFYLSGVLHDSANSSHYLGLYIIFFGKKKENIKMIKYSIALFLYMRLMFTENDKKPMTLTFNKHQSVEQFATDFFLFTSKIFGKWKQHVFFPQIMSDKQIKRERHENRLRLLPFIIIHGSLLFLCYYFFIYFSPQNKQEAIYFCVAQKVIN